MALRFPLLHHEDTCPNKHLLSTYYISGLCSVLGSTHRGSPASVLREVLLWSPLPLCDFHPHTCEVRNVKDTGQLRDITLGGLRWRCVLGCSCPHPSPHAQILLKGDRYIRQHSTSWARSPPVLPSCCLSQITHIHPTQDSSAACCLPRAAGP